MKNKGPLRSTGAAPFRLRVGAVWWITSSPFAPVSSEGCSCLSADWVGGASTSAAWTGCSGS